MNTKINNHNPITTSINTNTNYPYPLNNNHPSHSQHHSHYIAKGVYRDSITYNPLISIKTLDIVQVSGNPIVIGRGALSTVYLAKDPTSNINYAIKEMKKDTLMNTLGSFEPIYNEIDIQSRLLHDNIIKIHNVYEDDNCFKIILEHASHGTLYSSIKRARNGISEQKAFNFFIQAASALHFLHANNIIHRDLKPENFIIGDDDVLKLCDFGWANRIYNNTRDTICGTVEYMAPEIIKREQYDKAIDIWSLGVLLYELIHQHSPFNTNGKDNNNANPYEIMNKIKDKDFLFERAISKECQDIITQMLEKDQKKRITIEGIFMHPWVKYYEEIAFNENNGNCNRNGIGNSNKFRKHLSVCSDMPSIRRQLTTNEQMSNFTDNSNKISKKEQSKKMKRIAAMILSDTIDIEDTRSTKSKSKSKGKDKGQGKGICNTTIKPKNRLSFKMEMKPHMIQSSTSRNTQLSYKSNESNESNDTAITPVKTMSVKLTNVWFSQLKKPPGESNNNTPIVSTSSTIKDTTHLH